MSAYLFAYGTLVFPEILEALVGRALPSQEARVSGYARYSVRQEAYPGLVREAGARTPGRLYSGADAPVLALLDRYESAFYERRLIQVETLRGQRLQAHTYVVPDQNRHFLTREAWDEERFRREHYAAYLVRCRQLRLDAP